MSVFGFTRLALAIRLPDLPLTVCKTYLILGGGAWGTATLLSASSLFRGTSWAPTLTRCTALALAVWYWLDRLVFVHTDYAQRSWPAAAFLTLLALACLHWALTRPAARAYFGEDSG